MVRTKYILGVLGAAAVLAGCASADSNQANLEITPAAGAIETASVGERGLTAEEQLFDCKKLTGRIQIGILELRSLAPSRQSSQFARSMHSVKHSVFGGSAPGLDPNGQQAAGYRKLEAYNRELAARDCKSYDLQQALAGTDMPPVPTVEASSKSQRDAPAAPQ